MSTRIALAAAHQASLADRIKNGTSPSRPAPTRISGTPTPSTSPLTRQSFLDRSATDLRSVAGWRLPPVDP
jgi:hypothetical protein